jgi:two-component system nitrogen regulation response regulator NtrX
MALEVLVVDDEEDIRDLVSGVLEDEGYAVRSAADSTAALNAIKDRRPSLVLLDVWLQGSRYDGLQLLQLIKRQDPTLPVLMISGHGNLDTAVAAVREGAVDFIEKPFEAGHLLHLVSRATETDRLRRENESLRQQIVHDEVLSGTSVAINTVRATLKRVAPTGSRVLLTGPAGVGKEVAARTIHQWSTRANGPFVVVSAAMMTPERVEEELFGVDSEDGSRPGLLEQAHGGTLFLDEIAAGRFREDLYYRLNVVPVHLPPLTERREDIPALVDHFVARYAAERRVPTPEVAGDAMAALQAYDWPGNVRQLRNIVERTIIMAPGDRIGRIDIDMLPPEVLSDQPQLASNATTTAMMGAPLREARETFEREYLRVQIRRFSGNISRTASFIGMERSALHRKLKLLGLADSREEE